MNPTELLENALENAKKQEYVNINPDLHVILENAAGQKGVFGVVLTSIVYKILHPEQDIRQHQDHMQGGYSGRTFDTNFVTPFLRRNFPAFSMAESAWLTRSLEQPHPYNQAYPGKIRNLELKKAFLNTLELLQAKPEIIPTLLEMSLAYLWQQHRASQTLLSRPSVVPRVGIRHIIEAVNQHLEYPYPKGITGAARIPVVAMYAIYRLLMTNINRYQGKVLSPLEAHTSADSKSKALGDIDVLNADNSQLEAIEIKHNKPISSEMIDVVYQKIKNAKLERYYILTTATPNLSDVAAVTRSLEQYAALHPCQIIVNGVIPSLKYYLRLLDYPEQFLNEYRQCLEAEFKRSSGIKKEHLEVWHEIVSGLPNG
jgi:DNA (cytosine-5)-methyltransferase 1